MARRQAQQRSFRSGYASRTTGFTAHVLARVLLAAAQSASVAITYRYTGNTLTPAQDPTPPAGSYIGTERVVVTLTLGDAIPANSTNLDIAGSLLGFSFSDGRSVVTTGSPVAIVSTDAVGSITSWRVTINETSGCTSGIAAAISATTGQDSGAVFDCGTSNDDGTWVASGDLVTYRYEGRPWGCPARC